MNEADKRSKKAVSNLRFTFDPSEAYTILGKQVESGEDTGKLYVKVSQDVKSHETLRHTASLETLGCILNNLTFRCSSLTSANLNDKSEKERVNIEQFASSRYISCFSYLNRESIHFWGLYGDKCNKSKNVQLVFRNFGNFFTEAIHMDYCLIAGGKKALFRSKELKFSSDYDSRNWIDSIELIEIEYLSVDDKVFSKDFSSQATIRLGGDSNSPTFISKQYEPISLGRQKSETWADEKEIRILCCLYVEDFKDWSYIDLRLKEEIFQDMTIIMNPWADASFENEIKYLVDNSPLSNEVKSTITIQCSSEKGKVNL